MLDFPDFRQTFEYDCGAKALHSVLTYFGIDTNEINIIKIANTNKHNGTPLDGVKKVAGHFKLKCRIKKMDINEIKKYIDREIPVILLVQAWPKKKVHDWKKSWENGHFVVAIGYDNKRIYFEDPYDIHRSYLTYSELLDRWHDIDTAKNKKYYNLGIILLGKKKYVSKKIVHMK